jgi:MATE family multidrug resistance protein
MQGSLTSWWRARSGGREVLVLAVPLIVSTLSWTIMQFTDRMFLMWYSADAVAAGYPSALVWWLMICLPLGICGYTNVFVSQYYGAGRLERIGPAVWQGVWVGLAASPLLISTIPLAPAIFALADHPEQVTQFEIIYYQVLCYSAGPMLAAEAFASFFTGRGLTRPVMLVNAASAVVNVVLDYVWIFGHLGFPAAGIEGAAWATVVAIWFKLAAFLWLFLRPEHRREFGTWKGRSFDRQLMGRLLRFGTPNGLQLVLEVAGFTVFMMYVGRLGEVPLVASNLALNVSTLAFMPIYGLGIAGSTLVGQRLGENRDDLAARAAWSAWWISLTYMGFISALYVLVPDLFLSVYRLEAQADQFAELRHMTVVLLRFVAAYNLADALTIIFSGAIKGAGDTRFLLYATIVTALLLAGGSFLVVELFDGGVYAIWAYMAGCLWVMGLIYLIRFIRGCWREMRVIEKATQADEVPVIAETSTSAIV